MSAFKKLGTPMSATVLVVHSDTDARELMLSALRAAGFDATGFGDPMIALDAVESDSNIKVLVTRINFGEGRLNGVALARMLRHNVPRDIKVVFVGRPENRRHVDDGQGEFIPHPISPRALVDAVGRTLAAD
jgi:DNA-binding NtrC family response regulator